MMPDKIENDVVVTMRYRLTLDDGTFVEETDSADPLMYLHGHENIIPGLERELEGLRIGDSRSVLVDPEDAYGIREEDAIQGIPLDEFPADLRPEIGMLLELTDEDGESFEAEIVGLEEELVLLDFNHPLAGKRLKFDVEVLDLRAPTREELDHGHVHTGGHH